MGILEKLYTAEDLASLPDDGKRHELIRGRIVETPPPKPLYGRIASLIGYFLLNYVRERDLGEVYIHEVGYLLATDPDTVRGPDVSFVRAEAFAQVAGEVSDGYPDFYFPFAPTIAVEVVSPGNSGAEIDDKVADYLNAGAEMVWIVYPRRQHVEVYKAGGDVQLLTVDDALTGGDVLPGFEVPLREIFPAPKKNT